MVLTQDKNVAHSYLSKYGAKNQVPWPSTLWLSSENEFFFKALKP